MSAQTIKHLNDPPGYITLPGRPKPINYNRLPLIDYRKVDPIYRFTDDASVRMSNRAGRPITDANFTTTVALWFSDEASATETYGPIGLWDVTGVTDMSEAFKDKATFNEDVGDWDVRNVTHLTKMFQGATAFDQNIGAWNTSSVTHMVNMFKNASSFNHYVGGWNTDSTVNMNSVFVNATSFNQDVSAWNTSTVTNMRSMFQNATSFIQDISVWDVGAVTNHTNFSTGTDPLWLAGMKPAFGP